MTNFSTKNFVAVKKMISIILWFPSQNFTSNFIDQSEKLRDCHESFTHNSTNLAN